MSPLTVAFWALVAVAAFGLIFDFYALKVVAARSLAIATLALKAVVAALFVVWWTTVRVQVGVISVGAVDLKALSTYMVVAVALLLAALACELAAWAAVRRSEGSSR